MKEFKAYVTDRMYDLRLNQNMVAYELGMSQQKFSYKLIHATFNLEELQKLFDILKSTKEEIAEIYLIRRE